MATNFSPPEQVRKNAARSLELRRKHGRGMTAVGVARARDLSNGKNIPADTIRRMHSYFARHEVDKKGKDWANQSNPSAGYIAWLGWGGDAGRSWVNGIIKKLDAKESEGTLNMASTKSAIIRGIFIRPGVSKNRRLYTRENIGKAIERMKTQLASGEGMPISMATSHGAAFNDDALATVGRITHVVQLPDGSGQFEAEIANTSQGRDIAALTVGRFIKGVSIRGEWMGNLDTVAHSDGEEAMTAHDLRILGVDFTHSPGVDGAEVQYAVLAESYTASPYNIVESIEQVEVIERDESLIANEAEELIRAAVEDVVSSIMEKDSSKPYGSVTYADPGYQADKKKRYPVDTAKHVRAAWSYINQAGNASVYSAAQLRRIKSKIKSAAKKFGIDIQEEYSGLISDLRDAIETQNFLDTAKSSEIAARLAHITLINADEGHVMLNARGEDLATILRHDAGHDDWHAKHGDPPCKSPEDCARMAAAYEEEENNLDMSNEGGMSDDPNMECHECGTECRDGAAYCHACGANLPTEMHADVCGNCGAESMDSAMYCPTCGHPVPQAESTDDALTQTKENVQVDENITAAETSAEESGHAPVEARTLNDADLKALAAMVIAGLKPTENAPEAEVEAEVEAHAEEVEAPVADAEEVVADAEVSNEEAEAETPQENTVESNLFTAEQVAAMISEAASKAATEAVAATRKEAVESYRSTGGGRKGLVSGSAGTDASDLSESEITSESLAEMNSSDFRKVQAEVWGNTNFFSTKFAQADRGF
jgi:hypothetical protein